MRAKEILYRDANTDKIVARSLYTLQGKLLESQDFGMDGITDQEFEERMGPRKNQRKEEKRVKVSVNSVGIPNEPIKAADGRTYGVPDPPNPQWGEDGKPCFQHLQDDPIARVKNYLTSEHGEEEALKKIRAMDGIELLRLNDRIKKGELKGKSKRREDGTGVPDMPEPKWNPDGSPDFSDL